MSVYTVVTPDSSAEVPAKSPRVPTKLSELGAVVDTLDKYLSELGNKISPVSIPSNPTDGNKTPSIQEPCPLAEELSIITRKVGDLCGRVENMILRLEI